MDDFEEVQPLVSSSSSLAVGSSLGGRRARAANPKEAASGFRCCVRSRCFISCLAIAVLALLSCMYVDKEAVADLGKRSSSFIRKKGQNLSLGTPSERNTNMTENHIIITDETNTPAKDATESNQKEGDVIQSTAQQQEIKPGEGADAGNASKGNNAVAQAEDDPQEILDIDNAPTITKFKHHAVVHVGPQKTGSTTLQSAWHMPQGLNPDLKKDNYRYAFINPHNGFFNCDVTQYGGWRNCKPSRKLNGIVNKAKQDGKNLLLSDENLDSFFAPALQSALDREHWKVTVIVVYRRIHEWLVSWYNQINKTTNKDIHGEVLITDFGMPYRTPHKYWPDQGGQRVPGFSEWYKSFTKSFDRSDLVSRHRSVALVNTYKPLFDEVVVHNMHEEGDLVTNFMCDSMPDADECCNRLKNGALQIPRENASVNLDHDILAVAAREQGLLQKSLKRPEVHDAVSKFIKRTGIDVPRKCDNEMIEEIRGWLMGSEEEILNNNWTEQKSQNLEEIFSTYLKKGKLCDVDLDQVFENPRWVDFFTSLDNRPTLVLHVGPQKTASTTLQNAWASPAELLDLLKQDNFAYAKITPEKGMFDCGIQDGKDYSGCQATAKLKKKIGDASKRGQHLILSDENLNEVYAPTLRQSISEKDFKVKVVVVYRPIHQWMTSWYSQINKSTNKDENGNILVDSNGHLYRTEHLHFPSLGGEAIPSFSAWYNHFVQKFDSDDLADKHPSIHFKNVYEPLFRDVEIFKMDQPGDLVTNFMCQMIPEAKKSCVALKRGRELPVDNAGVNLDFDIVAVAAYERGLVRTDITRLILTKVVEFYAERKDKPLPKMCDEEVQQHMRKWLFDSERAMFPKEWDATKEKKLGLAFDNYVSTGRLCDVDVEAVLADEEWIAVFDSLELLDLEALPGYVPEKSLSESNNSPNNHLVLHIGPQKTGSSTLQAAWGSMRTELEADNYIFQHITPERRDFDCELSRWGGFQNCEASDQLVSFIDENRKAGWNLLLSDENLDERYASTLRDVIQDSEWDITVVVVYRRIHEWLVSWWNQINKTTNLDSEGNVLIDEKGNPYREEHIHWPDQGGVHIPNFSTWYHDFTKNFEPSELVEKHRSVKFHHLYAELFGKDKITIYDMHHEGADLVTDFMCDVIPRADHSCLKLKDHEIDPPKTNPSVILDHDILSVYAYDQGYVNKSLSRRQVADAVGKYVKEFNKTLPRVCHPGLAKEIYEWLVASEEAMFADDWSPIRYEQMTDAYETFFAKGKLCDVDVEEAMRDQEWVDFFQSLGG